MKKRNKWKKTARKSVVTNLFTYKCVRIENSCLNNEIALEITKVKTNKKKITHRRKLVWKVVKISERFFLVQIIYYRVEHNSMVNKIQRKLHWKGNLKLKEREKENTYKFVLWNQVLNPHRFVLEKWSKSVFVVSFP